MRTGIPEMVRGCGYRKIGGLYLVSKDLTFQTCQLMPYPIHLCPCCGAGIKFNRGISWLTGEYFEKELKTKDCEKNCSLECPFQKEKNKKALMWVGEQFYPTPGHFQQEAVRMGISKRIASVPKDLVIGKTWVLVAHRKAIKTLVQKEGNLLEVEEMEPGIFMAFRPQGVEKILTPEMATDEELESLQKRGITPVIVEDHPRHKGSAFGKGAP